MTLCVIDGKQCVCQPDEGMACPNGTPAQVQAALFAIIVAADRAPAPAQAVPLTREQIIDLGPNGIGCLSDLIAYTRAVERAHGIGAQHG